ncbi:AraC family transcriptional regulator [Flexibacterium corallicola]|uniref:AraC family transcriptional regulator n=1 Tax=Flexibacterium corallicola TaxID=3037259 RepID=UPI00286F8A05|nr:AraC family transcriptional regulator [Pseudovibrio sp. M1P-2-3]
MPTNKVAHIIQLMESDGVKRQDILARTGINSADLLSPNALVSFPQSFTLIRNLLGLSRRPGLGLYVGQHENIGTCGLMGYAMSCAPNIGRAMELAVKYVRASATLTDILFSLDGDELLFTATPIATERDILPFVIEEVFSATLRIFHLISGIKLPPSKVSLSYSDPGYGQLYKKTFGCPVEFNRPTNTIIYDREVLGLPTLQGNPVSEAMAVKLCDKHLEDHGTTESVVMKVRRELIAHPSKFPSEEIIADKLQIHSRSLRRHLQSNGTSYQQILDSVREQLAKEYLQCTKMPMEEIAGLIGYSDTSNFRRAFKRWTQIAPSDFRKQAATELAI